MTSPAVPSGTPVRAAARTALRWILGVFSAMLIIGVIAGLLIDGAAGLYGALLGVGIAVVFSITTVISIMLSADRDGGALAGIVLGMWLAKMIVLFGLLLVLRPHDFYNRPIFAVVLCVAVLAAAIIDAVAVQRARIPLTQPGPSSNS
ncbi:hypothetical protein SAMN06309944_0667 [Micrococcales bacterium KH10]|nr:hypothetical protein SAMN06309944_0667 [Micrococcales bacterium KH10]